MAFIINPNKFSLHAMYRDRLIRAYLGASNPRRDPNPFTGFDESDNLKMAGLWRRDRFRGKLLPVLNIALNLLSGSKLAWQERKAESFTVTPLHCTALHCTAARRASATAEPAARIAYATAVNPGSR